MRIMLLTVLVVTGITAYGFSNQKPSEIVIQDAEKIIENINGEHSDPIVTGISISKEHLEKWQERRRRNAQCYGCYDLIQPYPGDES